MTEFMFFYSFPFPSHPGLTSPTASEPSTGRSVASCVASRTGRTGRTGIEPGDAALPSSFLLGLQLLIEIHLEISVRQRIPRLAKKATMTGVLHKKLTKLQVEACNIMSGVVYDSVCISRPLLLKQSNPPIV